MSLAQVIQKKKRSVILLGRVASNKFATVRTKQCKLGNKKESIEREIEKVRELAGHHRDSSSLISSSDLRLDSSSDRPQGVSVEIVQPKKIEIERFTQEDVTYYKETGHNSKTSSGKGGVNKKVKDVKVITYYFFFI